MIGQLVGLVRIFGVPDRSLPAAPHLNESVTQTGQSVGCYLTLQRCAHDNVDRYRCLPEHSDNGIAIVNWNLGAVPPSPAHRQYASTGQFKLPSGLRFDFNGGTRIWLPGGNPGRQHRKQTTCLVLRPAVQRDFMGKSTSATGRTPFAPAAFMQCEAHCSKLPAERDAGRSPPA